jgi:glucose-6-phosphate-specific signal transduction histidine kinase
VDLREHDERDELHEVFGQTDLAVATHLAQAAKRAAELDQLERHARGMQERSKHVARGVVRLLREERLAQHGLDLAKRSLVSFGTLIAGS